ncbi:DUF4255 domain-containing protein [Paraflavitalea sp. CAU 1676]|uniref:DUF4255 domain-containing protein n=1 Tax=Paraflavitalea sp. CAU 1676 TaxID=3032598 RepID=UPI0023DC931E|nr:DUF4255 domain-containing protein [Paraflavitalea sp. CAU 1676]MDF2188590.1 DUF4255 domain-containing protein [Paraflavitalea sp. CAU 1676]
MGPFLSFLKKDLNTFISNKIGASSDFVLCSNLNNVIDKSDGPTDIIVISIVSIEEEKMLKSPDNYVKFNNEINYRKPPIWLNIICLFTFYTKNHENYNGIDMLENVIQYFQSKPRIDKTNAVVPANYPAGLEEVRAEFVSLNYEQTNDLWGLFGGKYHPSVVYKFKTIPVDNADVTPGGPPIEETMVNALHKKI